jgi:thiamine biosynthesis protein ThiS
VISEAHLKPYSLAAPERPKWIRFLLYMKLRINGEEKEIADGLNLTGLLEQLQIRPARVVVERNREIVARESYGATLLGEGDTLEIVHFVGGG